MNELCLEHEALRFEAMDDPNSVECPFCRIAELEAENKIRKLVVQEQQATIERVRGLPEKWRGFDEGLVGGDYMQAAEDLADELLETLADKPGE